MCSNGPLAAHLLLILLLAPAAYASTRSAWARTGASSITLGSELFVSSAPPELAHDVVTLAYRGILGRDPDQGGLENYVQHLHDGRRHRGIVWLCSVLLESAEFNSRPRSLPDLAAQLHRGIEGCADDSAPVKTTRRLLTRAGSMTGSARENLGLIANRAAFLIDRASGAFNGTPLVV